MAGSYLNYQIKEFLIESYDGSTVINATECISQVQYFEDLFSPAIFVSMILVNTDGLLTSLPSKDPSIKPGIKGGERVRLIIEQTATKNNKKVINRIDFTDTNKNPYFIYKISGSTTESTREVFFVELAPAELFTNETSRVFRRYPEDEGGNQTIDITVQQILKDVLKTNKKLNKDQTQNSYAFFGNSKKPFTVLTWLCPKSIPTISSSSGSKGTAGFLFYENNKGYNFRSVDSLISNLDPNSASAKSAVKYSLPNVISNSASEASNFTIVSMPVFEKNVSIFENLRIGMYSSVNYFFDANTRELSVYEYKLSESYDLMKHASKSSEKPKIPNQLENSPSRLMVKIIDNLVTQSSDANENQKIDKREQYQSQSVSRYNLAFSQMLNITIPLNLNLTVGDVIQLDFSNITKDAESSGLRDDLKSGFYLIKELSHLFKENSGYTGLKLIRDSYGSPGT
jgi:hypothetical protein